jgi:hypothetical protein
MESKLKTKIHMNKEIVEVFVKLWNMQEIDFSAPHDEIIGGSWTAVDTYTLNLGSKQR